MDNGARVALAMIALAVFMLAFAYVIETVVK